MFHVVLYQPEIPANTGNIIRLCANTGVRLHLVGPLGFRLDDKQLKRAGLDYHEYSKPVIHLDWLSCITHFADHRLFLFSTKAEKIYSKAQYRRDDVLVFGSETRGVPLDVRERFVPDHRLRLPMQPENRSLNLANTVAVVIYEAWRQNSFVGGS